MNNEIKLICCDVDGTLTDGTINIGASGEHYKSFHVRDGLGILMAQKKGVEFAIVTGRMSEIVSVRAAELGIKEVYQNAHDKRVVVKQLRQKFNLTPAQVAYIGDDINDSIVKDEVGLFAVVSDAHEQAKVTADVILETPGGKGALRELIDRFIL